MILSAILERRSVREYAETEVTEEQVHRLIQAAQYAPTGMNTRAIEFIVLRTHAAKDALFALLEPKQPFVKEAPVIVIPVLHLTKIKMTGLDQTLVATSDLAIASAFIMTQATAMGLGTVWKHIPTSLVAKVLGELGVPSDYTLINALPIGYPKQKPASHQEHEFSKEKIHFEKW